MASIKNMLAFLGRAALCIAPMLLSREGLADGFIFIAKHFESLSSLPLVEEKGQLAYIDYDGKVEKPIISVTTGWKVPKAVWLFPVPSSPDSVHLKVLAILPDFQKYDIYSTAKEVLKTTKNLLIRGMVAGKITAKQSAALYAYLQGKGLRIGRGAIPIIDYYIGKNYIFIVAWLSNTPQEGIKARGIYEDKSGLGNRPFKLFLPGFCNLLSIIGLSICVSWLEESINFSRYRCSYR